MHSALHLRDASSMNHRILLCALHLTCMGWYFAGDVCRLQAACLPGRFTDQLPWVRQICVCCRPQCASQHMHSTHQRAAMND
jgi:hypothetical protein